MASVYNSLQYPAIPRCWWLQSTIHFNTQLYHVVDGFSLRFTSIPSCTTMLMASVYDSLQYPAIPRCWWLRFYFTLQYPAVARCWCFQVLLFTSIPSYSTRLAASVLSSLLRPSLSQYRWLQFSLQNLAPSKRRWLQFQMYEQHESFALLANHKYITIYQRAHRFTTVVSPPTSQTFLIIIWVRARPAGWTKKRNHHALLTKLWFRKEEN